MQANNYNIYIQGIKARPPGWSLWIANYAESEHHQLSKQYFLELLEKEWLKEFNSLFVAGEFDKVGRMVVVFFHANAYVAYEDFITNKWWSSYSLEACRKPNWHELVRFTPDDAEDLSFRRCSIISKDEAWSILEKYIASGELMNLALEDNSGRPAIPR